jgi:tetratricopeptide (TPR) repeat protein
MFLTKESLLQEISNALNENHASKAITLAEEGIRRFNSSECAFLLGAVLTKDDDRKSIYYLKLAKKIKPKEPYYSIALGIKWLSLKNFSKGRALLENGLAYATLDPSAIEEVFYHYGQIFNDVKQYDLALTSLLEYLKRGGDEFKGNLALAIITENLSTNLPQARPGALKLYEKALRINPKSYFANLGKFITSFQVGDSFKTSIASRNLNSISPSEDEIQIINNVQIHNPCELRKVYMRDLTINSKKAA